MMCNFVARRLAPVVAVVLVAAVPAVATTVMQMNLVEMGQRSAQIYRGTVLSATEGTVEAGGGQLPIVTYRLQVEEAFRGDIPVVKGMRIAEIQMIGKSKPVRRGNLRTRLRAAAHAGTGHRPTYLVFTTQPSAIGLSAIVGLGQGAFRIDQAGKARSRGERSEQQRPVPRHDRAVGPGRQVAGRSAASASRPGAAAPSRTTSWPARSALSSAGFRRR